MIISAHCLQTQRLRKGAQHTKLWVSGPADQRAVRGACWDGKPEAANRDHATHWWQGWNMWFFCLSKQTTHNFLSVHESSCPRLAVAGSPEAPVATSEAASAATAGVALARVVMDVEETSSSAPLSVKTGCSVVNRMDAVRRACGGLAWSPTSSGKHLLRSPEPSVANDEEGCTQQRSDRGQCDDSHHRPSGARESGG